MSDLTMNQIIQIECEVTSGRSWEDRSDAVPDTAEARAKWDTLAAEVADILARGQVVDVPFD